jgi:hypothetical protein
VFPGDSYVILHTQKAAGGQLSHDIHFWQGKESSQVLIAFASLCHMPAMINVHHK